jgi:hydroxypyruvate isomerase
MRESQKRNVGRRDLIRASALLTAGAALPVKGSEPLGPPPYTVSINIEIMFPKTMPRARRVEIAAAQGVKAFSFWSTDEKEQDEMLEVMHRTGLKCASISGNPKLGRTTGLTKLGSEGAFLDEIATYAKIAAKMGGATPIIFPGALQPDTSWEAQRANIVKGLKLAGEIAKEQGVVLTLEPEDQYEAPKVAIHKTSEAYPIVEEVAHPNVKICFDIYHLQLSEGNITNNLKTGLSKGLIGLVQIGESPGRKEPGTGETDYAHIFRVLRASGYTGYVDTEHGTTSTPEYAINLVRQLSLNN